MIDLGPPPKVWMPPKPAIIRSAADLPKRATFPTPTYCPGDKLKGFTLAMPAVEAFGSTVTVPEGVRSKDVALLIQYGQASGTTVPTLVYPPDHALIDTRGQTITESGASTVSPRYVASMKVLDGDEDGQVLTGISFGSKHLLIFRPVGSLKGISAQSINGQITGGNPTLQTIGAAAFPAPVIVLGIGTTSSPSPTGTLATNGTKIAGLLSGVWVSVWCEIQTGTTANRTWDTGEVTHPNILASFALVGV